MKKCEICNDDLNRVVFNGNLEFRNGRTRKINKEVPTDGTFLNITEFLKENNLNIKLIKTLKGKFTCKTCGSEIKIYSF